MPNSYFRFKQFTINQDRCAMKVTTDSCLFGAWVAEKLYRGNKSFHMLDIGAGTGLLSLMIAQKSTCSITAIEIDNDAFGEALENINGSPWPERLQLIHADIKEVELELQYDIIVSNPPFYENEWQSGDVQKNTAHHSQQLTLFQLLKTIKDTLAITGRFYLLLPFKRDSEVKQLLEAFKLFISDKVLVRQSESHGFFRVMLEGQLSEVESTESEMSIKKNNGDYSDDFTRLLKDYYLYL